MSDEFEDVAVHPRAGDRIYMRGGRVHYVVAVSSVGNPANIQAVMAERYSLVGGAEKMEVVTMDGSVWTDLVNAASSVVLRG